MRFAGMAGRTHPFTENLQLRVDTVLPILHSMRCKYFSTVE